MDVTAGKANVSVYFYITGNASHASPGAPITGLLYSDIETGGSASYVRQGAARVDLTLITLASASASHADGGFVEVDATNMPGVYRCDYPDAAFVTGVDFVICQIVAAAANNANIPPVQVNISDAQNSLDNLLLGIIFGSAVTGTLSTISCTSDLTGYTEDQLVGRIITVTSGVAEGESSAIKGYTEANGLINFDPITLAMGNGDTFKIT